MAAALPSRPSPRHRRDRSAPALALLILATSPGPARAATTQVAVDPGTVVHTDARLLLGVTFEARTGTQLAIGGGNTIPAGYYDSANQILPTVAPLWSQVRLTTVRYPANSVDLLDWRGTVGPIATRPAQYINPAGSQSQVIGFGFDEFMAMIETHNPPGTPAPEVQIMVSIKTSLNVATPAEVLQMAADWVEYANSPNDSTNPGGGIDWAARRAANGRHQPYGIRIWNIGNEPWGPGQPYEFNRPGNAAAYAALAQQFIAAMKAIDPTILITLPSASHPTPATPDNAAQATWDNTLLAQLGGEIHALVPHMFYDGTLARGVQSCAASIDAVRQRIAASAHPSVQVLLGDHAHAIPGGSPTPAQADFAMQWQGAVTTADFLLMCASRPLARVNFWAFGSTAATWHPIRRDTGGGHTLLPVGALYARLGQELEDHALSVSTTSPPSLDGTAGYSVRAGAFRSADGGRLVVLLVNRDSLAAQTVALAGIAGYQPTGATLLTADRPDAEQFVETPLPVPPAGGDYAMPPSSLLLIELAPATLAAAPIRREGEPLVLSAPRPNPARDAASFDLTLPAGESARVEIVDVAGRRVRTLAAGSGPGRVTLTWDLRDREGRPAAAGLNFPRVVAPGGRAEPGAVPWRRLIVQR